MKNELIKQAMLSLIPLAYISSIDVMSLVQSIAGIAVLGIQGGYLLWKWNRESRNKKNDSTDSDTDSLA